MVGGPAWGCLAGELIFLVELIKDALKQGAEPGSPAASHPHFLGQDLTQSHDSMARFRPVAHLQLRWGWTLVPWVSHGCSHPCAPGAGSRFGDVVC